MGGMKFTTFDLGGHKQGTYDYKPYTLYSELCRKLKVAIMFDMNFYY